MATDRFPGIDKLVEDTIRTTGPLTVAELVARLAERGITRGQVRNAIYRLKRAGKIGDQQNASAGSPGRYEVR